MCMLFRGLDISERGPYFTKGIPYIFLSLGPGPGPHAYIKACIYVTQTQTYNTYNIPTIIVYNIIVYNIIVYNQARHDWPK